MKIGFAVFSFLIFLTNPKISNAQEKWTCYTDDKLLLMDDYSTLGVFEYTDGSLWMITDRGINIFDGNQWEKIDNKTDAMNRSISSYLVDSKNRIWVGSNKDVYYGPAFLYSYDDGVVIFDGNNWSSKRTKDLGFKAPVVTKMFESSNGDIWLGVSTHSAYAEKSSVLAKGAILRYSNDEWSVYRYKDILCLTCDFVKGFSEDADGKLWLWGTQGLAYFEDGKFHCMTKKNGYLKRGQRINATFIDSNNKFWIGGPGKAARWDGDSWTTYTRKNGLAAIDWGVYGFSETSDGEMVVAVGNGVYRYDGIGEWSRDKKEVLSSNIYIDKQDRTWVPTFKGLEIRDGDEATLDKELTAVGRIISDKNGGIWAFSPKDGAKRLKDGEWKHYTEKNQLPSSRINMAYVTDDGTIWIGTKKGICSCEYGE